MIAISYELLLSESDSDRPAVPGPENRPGIGVGVQNRSLPARSGSDLIVPSSGRAVRPSCARHEASHFLFSFRRESHSCGDCQDGPASALIELLVVIAIIAVLIAAPAAPAHRRRTPTAAGACVQQHEADRHRHAQLPRRHPEVTVGAGPWGWNDWCDPRRDAPGRMEQTNLFQRGSNFTNGCARRRAAGISARPRSTARSPPSSARPTPDRLSESCKATATTWATRARPPAFYPRLEPRTAGRSDNSPGSSASSGVTGDSPELPAAARQRPAAILDRFDITDGLSQTAC